MAKHRPPTEAKLLELLETVHPTKAASSSEHNIRHFVESTGRDQQEKIAELKDAHADIRRLIAKACENGVVSSERQWAVMCRRIEQRVQKTKNTLRFALLSRRLEEALEWAKGEVHADSVAFDAVEAPAKAHETPATDEPAPQDAAEPVAADQYQDSDEAAFAALLAQEEEELALAALIEEEELAALERSAVTTAQPATVELPVHTTITPPTAERMHAPGSLLGTIDAERGQRTPEAFLKERVKEFAWAMFDEEFLPALRMYEKELHFDDALSLETTKRILKLVGALERKIDEIMDERIPALLAAQSALPQVAPEEAFFKELWNIIRAALTATESAIQERILQHGANPNKTELPRIVLNTFLSHCLENGRSYLDIITEPSRALAELPRLQLQPAADGKPKAIETLRRERVLQRLIPTRCTGDSVPLSRAEIDFLERRMAGKGRINNSMRAELMRELQDRFTGGAAVRSEQYFRTVVEPEVVALLKLQRDEALAAASPAAAAPEPTPKAETPKTPTLSPAELRAATLKAYVENNIATPLEVSVLAELSRNKIHRKSIHQGKYDEIAAILNEQCWGGQPERNNQFVENVIAAIRIGIVHPAAPAPQAQAAVTVEDESPVETAPEEEHALATEAAAAPDVDDAPIETAAEEIDSSTPLAEESTVETSANADVPTEGAMPAVLDGDDEAAITVETTTVEQPETMDDQIVVDAAEHTEETTAIAAEDEPALEREIPEELDETNAAEIAREDASEEGIGEKTERVRTLDGYSTRLHGQIATHATMRSAPIARLQNMVMDILTLTDDGELLLEEFTELMEGRKSELDSLRMGAAILQHGEDLSEERIRAVCSVQSIDELRACAERFLADTESGPGKLERIEASFDAIREEINGINKDLKTANQFFARDLQRITLTGDHAEAVEFVRNVLGEKVMSLLSEEDPAIDQAKQEIHGALDGMMNGVLRDLQEFKEVARRREDAKAILAVLEPKKQRQQPKQRAHETHHFVEEQAINGTESFAAPNSLKDIVARMTMGKKKDAVTYDISLLQARLLQLLIVFPNVVQDGDGDEVKPRSKSYNKLWHGRGPWELELLWKEMFGEESPSKEEIAEALHAIASEGRKGMASSNAGPAARERESAVTPLLKFCNNSGHLKFVPADPTFVFVRSLNGSVAMTSEFEEKLAGLLDAKARAKQEKSKSMRKPKQ